MKNILLGFALISLVSCATPSGDMLNNKFDSAITTTQENIGYYTGSIGPYTATFKINSDGTGYYCESMGSNQTDHYLKAKFTTDMFYASNGGRFKIVENNKEKIIVQNIYFGINTKYTLIKDDSLSRSAPFCEKQFK